MLPSRHSTFSLGRRIAAIACAVGAGLLAAPTAARAQQTSKATIVGSLANFDAINDTEGEKQGFEIQLEHIQSQDITRIFGQSGASCYIRYCIGSITPYGDPVAAPAQPWGIYVRWMANYNAATQSFSTPPHAPGGGTSGTPSRFGVANAPLVNGEQCWSFGLAGAYPSSGCEHFGISTAFGKNPTQTTYRWLVGDPATGALSYPSAVVGGVVIPAAPVQIPQPVAVVAVNAAGVQEVQAAIQAPQPPPCAAGRARAAIRQGRVGEGVQDGTDRAADLDELVGGHPNARRGACESRAGGNRVEAAAIRRHATPTNGSSQLRESRLAQRRFALGRAAVRVLQVHGPRRGARRNVAEAAGGGEARCRYDQEASLCASRDANNECVAPGPGELGDYIGAQMAADNLGGVLADRPDDRLHAAGVAQLRRPGLHRRPRRGGASGNPVVLTASGACATTATPAVLTITGTGTCMVTATQAGNASFAPAAPVIESVNVAAVAGSVSFDAGTLSRDLQRHRQDGLDDDDAGRAEGGRGLHRDAPGCGQLRGDGDDQRPELLRIGEWDAGHRDGRRRRSR